MAIKVTPEVWIDGYRVACTPEAVHAAPTAVRGFEITWGREEYQDPSVSPASMSLYLLDTTEQWAGRIRDSQAIGVRVEIRWTGTNTYDGSTVGPVTAFRGRIAHAEATPHGHRTADNRRAWLIHFTVADRTADYGNAFMEKVIWPRETMIVRANKIRNHGVEAGSEITQVYFWPGYVDTMAAPLDTEDKSALDLMAEFYASMGNDSYAYDPDQNVIRQAIRLSQPMTTYLATFDTSYGAVIPVASDITVDGQVYPGVGLGGCELVGEPSITADASTDINRLECSWKDYSTGHKDWTTVKDEVAPGDGRRVMAWDSWLDDGRAIDPTLDNVWARAREEGRRPRHPAVAIPPTHEFVSERLARWLLQTWENTRPAFIAGSLAYLWLMRDQPGYSPIVAPIGGRTAFDPERGWSAVLNVHWIHNNGTPPSPVTWQAIRAVKETTTAPTDPWWWSLLGLPPSPPVTVGSPTPARDIKWGDPGQIDGYGFDKSVTWADLRHVETTNAQVKDVLE